MNRPFGPLLLTLSIAAALTVGAAHAQSAGGASSQAQSTKETSVGPLQSLFALFQSPAQAQTASRSGVESQSLPPLAGQSGHQFGSSQPAVDGSANTDAARPPNAVGTVPAPAGVASSSAEPDTVMSLPPDDQPEKGSPQELAPNLKRQLVDFKTTEPAGTIIVDTAHTYLYLVLGGGKALRYGVRVGREGFTWSGTERISRMKEWPDWFPPAEMIERQPYLPRFMAGGDGNPLGARAMYLGKTLYRIHGTNQPSTIGHYVSSGCVGMLNSDVEDLYSRVQVGTRVVVLPGKSPETVASGPPPPANPMAPPAPANPMAPPQQTQGSAHSGPPLSMAR
jgi:lipoprotein-anchoring transpeptidase ErfK/SrfK